jgi:hypothetical protein
MKVYRISKRAFLGICLLILILPVSRHWKLLTTGARTTGTVNQVEMRIVETIGDEKEILFQSEIEFLVNGAAYKTYGPANFEYKPGRSVPVFYNRKDPSINCIATFSGFYLTNYVVLPIILITVWYAFYLSFNNYQRRVKLKIKKQKFSKFGPLSVKDKN